MMVKLSRFVWLMLLVCGSQMANGAHSPNEIEINKLMDGFHEDASAADFDSYFDRFVDNGYFLGTDASERWSVAEFKKYARPHFDAGRGWTYIPVERNIARNGEIAWFDEQLDNEKLGRCRGTGVLIRKNGRWKVLHYSLTLLIPNSIATEVGSLSIKAFP